MRAMYFKSLSSGRMLVILLGFVGQCYFFMSGSPASIEIHSTLVALSSRHVPSSRLPRVAMK